MGDITMEEQPASARPKIQWGQPALALQLDTEEGGSAAPPANTLAAAAAVLDGEREKHEKRAARFSVEVRPPEKRHDLRDEARKKKALERHRGPDFATGMDFFTEEELKRRKERSERFQTADRMAEYQSTAGLEKEAQKKARAQRFGVAYQATDESGIIAASLLEEKRDVAKSVARRPEALHVYGVDLLSTSELLSYFSEYGPTFVEWINDSSCNVLFADSHTAKRAIFGLGKPLPPADIPDGQDIDRADILDTLEFLWHKGADFLKAGTPVPVIFRVATVEDKRGPSAAHTTRRLWLAADHAGGSGRGRRGDREGGGLPENGGRQRRRRREEYEPEADVTMMDAGVGPLHVSPPRASASGFKGGGVDEAEGSGPLRAQLESAQQELSQHS